MCARRWTAPVFPRNVWTLCRRDLCSRTSVRQRERDQKWIQCTDFMCTCVAALSKRGNNRKFMSTHAHTHTKKKSQSHTSVRFSTCQLSVRSQGVCETLKHFNEMRFYWGSVSRKGPRREASKHVVLVPNFLRHATHGCLHLAGNH